jgi:hypothetical protein
VRSRGKSRAAGSLDATGEAMRSATSEAVSERRAWDLNPRDFRLPVFKTGALGRYASPPWGNLPFRSTPIKITIKAIIEIQRFDSWAQVEFVTDREHMDYEDRDHCDYHSEITIDIERVENDEE